MNRHVLRFAGRSRYALFAGCLFGQALEKAQASDATWNTTSGSWGTGSNWLPTSAPGATSGTTNPDTATFNGAGGSLAVTVDANRNLKNITFDTAAGTYTLSSGNLLLSAGGTTSLASTLTSTSTETVSSPVTLEGNYTFANNATTAGLLRFLGNVTGVSGGTSVLTLGGSNTSANLISGVIANGASGGATSLVKTGAGSWSLSGANTMTGSVAINNGTLTLSNGGSVAGSAFTVGQTGSNVNTSLAVTTNAGGTKTAGSSLTYNGSFNAGASNFNLTGNSAGNAIVSYGALTLGSGELSGGISPNSATNVQALFSGVTRAPGTHLVLTSTKIGTNTISSATANTSNVVFTTAPTLTGGGGATGSTTISILPWAFVGGTLSTYDSTTGLRPLGASELATLSTSLTSTQNATMTAGTTLASATSVNALRASGGTLTLGTGSASDTTALTVNSGAIIITSNVSIGATSGNGVLAFGSAEGNVHVNNTRTLAINSVITGSGGLTVSLDDGGTPSANLVLAAANTFTGTTTFEGNNPALQVYLTNSQALKNTTLDYNNYGASFTFGNVTGTGGQTAYAFGALKGAQNITLANNNIAVQAVTLTVGGNNASTTYSGVLSDGTTAGGALVKTGTGAFTVTGANSYTGGTTVSGGSLLANNTSGTATGSGAVAVQSGATLGGGNSAANSGTLVTLGTLAHIPTLQTYQAGQRGLIGGAVQIQNGGILAPGNSVGTLTMASLTLNVGSLLTYEFNGTANDFSAVTSTLTLNGGSFSLYQEGTTTAFATAGTYDLFSYGTLAGDIMNLTVANKQAGFSYTFFDDSADGLIQLQIAVVPEPGTWAMMLAGLACLFFVQRRKNGLN